MEFLSGMEVLLLVLILFFLYNDTRICNHCYKCIQLNRRKFRGLDCPADELSEKVEKK